MTLALVSVFAIGFIAGYLARNVRVWVRESSIPLHTERRQMLCRDGNL